MVLCKVTEEICYFIHNSYLTDEKYIKYIKVIQELFAIYTTNQKTLPPTSVAHIYTKLLNEKQNIYVATNRKSIINHIKQDWHITDKKKERLLIKAKLKRAKNLIKNRQVELLGIDFIEIMESLWKLHININKSKPFNKNPLTEAQFNKLDNLFVNDDLTYDKVKEICPNLEKSAIKKLTAKYNRILLPIVSDMQYEALREKNAIEFNYRDLKIFNKEQYEKNLEKLLSLMNEEEKEYIIAHEKELSICLPLLSFMNLPYLNIHFNIEIFKYMLLNFEKIKFILKSNGKILNNTTSILNDFKECLRLSEILHNADKITCSILGQSRVDKIILSNKSTSSNTYDYVNTYIKMLNNGKTYLPPVSFTFQIQNKNYKIESGNNYDLDRLLIGKEVLGSCIGPNAEGEDTFYKCLTTEEADVLLIKEENTLEFFARIIMIRLGNTIVLAPIYGKEEIAYELYTKEFLNTLSSKLLENSLKREDNIDHILIAQEDELDKEEFDVYIDYTIGKAVPHCDIYSSVNQIYSTNKNKEIDYFEEPKVLYEKTRKKIEIKEQDYTEDISKLEALYYLMTKKKEIKEPSQTYKYVYIGQDFYIGVGEDRIYSTCLPTNDERQKREIDACLEDIISKSDTNMDILEKKYLKK